MSTANRQLRKLQIGLETTAGDLAARTRQLIGNCVAEEIDQRYRDDYPRSYVAEDGGAGITIMRATKFPFEGFLSPEQILWPANSGVRQVTPVADTLTGTTSATSSSTFTDSSATWTVNGLAGAAALVGSSTGTIASNTATVATVGSWSGGTPTSVSAYTITLLSFVSTYTPQLTTAIPTLDTVALEAVDTDGSTNHYVVQAGYGICESFGMAWAFNKEATMSAVWNARANQYGSPTGSLSPYSSLSILNSNLLRVNVDTTWAAAVGNTPTQLSAAVRSAKCDIQTGIMPNFTLDARSGLDMTGTKVSKKSGKISVVCEANAATAAAFTTHYRANDIIFIGLKNVAASTIAGSNGGAPAVELQASCRFTSNPKRSDDGDQTLLAFDLEFVRDPTSNNLYRLKSTHALSAIA